MRRAVSAYAVSFLVLGVLGATGGVNAAAAGPPLTKDQYVAAYNTLCDAASTKTQAALQALPRDHSNDDFVHAIVPIFQHRVKETRKLVPPTADHKKVKTLLAAQQDAINKVKDNPEALSGGRLGESPGEHFRKAVGKKADKLAKAYGLESGICLEGGGGSSRPCPPGGRPCPGQGGTASPFVTAVCAAETTLHTTLQSERDAVKAKSDPAAQKQGFVDFISGLPAQINTLEQAINQAGVPAVPNGSKIVKAYLDTLNAIIKKVPALRSMAEALPTSSSNALQSAGKSIGTTIDRIKRQGDAKVSSLDPSGVVAGDLARCGGIFPL